MPSQISKRECTKIKKTLPDAQRVLLDVGWWQCPVYSDLRRKLYSTTKYLYPEFEDMYDLEKLYFLLAILYPKAILRRRSLLFHRGNLVLAGALAYVCSIRDIPPTGLGDDYWILGYICITTAHSNGAWWWLLNYMLYLYYDTTWHINKVCVMQYYVTISSITYHTISYWTTMVCYMLGIHIARSWATGHPLAML